MVTLGSRLFPVTATGDLRHPGLRRDERGVVLGKECLLRFASLNDLVAFLRLYALRGELNALLPELEALSLLSESGGNDFGLRLGIRSTRDVEALLETALLCNGQVFVGDGRSFVPFRNAEAPFGYDLAPREEPLRGLTLIRPAAEVRYPDLRRIDLPELVYSLPLLRHPTAWAEGAVVLQVPPGLYPSCSDYLLRHGQGVEVALLEVHPQQRWYLFNVKKLSAIGAKLLARVPGVRILQRVQENVLLPLGWKHPLPLESMGHLQPRDGILILQVPETSSEGLGLPKGALQPIPPLKLPAVVFHPHQPPLLLGRIESPRAARALDEPPQRFSLNVHLVPNGQKEDANGLLIPHTQHEMLRRMLQTLPASLLEDCRLAAGSDVAVLLGPPQALRALPLGLLLKAQTQTLYLPVGTQLIPAPPPDALARMFVGPPEGDTIVLTQQVAYHFPAKALLPLSRLMVARFYSRRISLLNQPPELTTGTVEFQTTRSKRLPPPSTEEPEDE